MGDAPTQRVFTAARFAAVLRVTPQAMRHQLRDAPAPAKVLSGGQLTAAWPLDRVPPSLRERLRAEARRLGYRDAEALLSAPPKGWEPDIPKRDICLEDWRYAQTLQRALTPSLLRQHDPSLSRTDFEQRGIEDYRREFGSPISDRYFRELIARVRARDAGAEEWTRLDIFLPEKLSRPKAAESSAASTGEFSDIAAFIAACVSPSAPNETERRGIWTLAFQHFDRLVIEASSEKTAARKIRAFLFAQAPFLAPSMKALWAAFDRKLARWKNGGRDAKTLRDRRENNGERFDLPEDDRDLLIHTAVFTYRGDVASAWRELREGQRFTKTTREHYATAPRRKSYVPAKVMEDVRGEVEILTTMHQGPRAFDAIKGHVRRNYDGIASLQAVSADDFTLPVYFFVPDGKGGITLTRGQCLIVIDFRTLNVLAYSLEPNRNYSSLTIRSLCTHVFSHYGVPDVIQFERGIWQSAALIKGVSVPFGMPEVAQGLREFGIKFIHSIRPRSKAVERVGGMLQDLMEAEPGYCGRNERVDAPESLRKQMAQVDAGADPSKWFYSYEQWNKRLGEIIARYNAAPQQGRILDGLSPDQGFEKYLDWNNPPKQFAPEIRFLLAHDRRQVRVTLNGITVQVGKKKFNYRGVPLAKLVGKDVLRWFDPQNPDALVVTDLDRRNPVCVPLAEEPSALECLTVTDSEPLSRAMQKVKEQSGYMRTRFTVLKKKFPLPQRRALVDAQMIETVETGRRIEEQKEAVRSQRVEQANLSSRARQLAAVGVTAKPEHLRDVSADDLAFYQKYCEDTP